MNFIYHPLLGTSLFLLCFAILLKLSLLYVYQTFRMLLMKYFEDNKSGLKSIYILQFDRPTIGIKGSQECLGKEEIIAMDKNLQKIYTNKSLLQNVRPKFLSLKFLTQKKPPILPFLKHSFYCLKKGKDHSYGQR